MQKLDRYFRVSSKLTDTFPRIGALALDNTVPFLLGNSMVVRAKLEKNIRLLRKIGKFDSILIIADLNIGDGINLQACADAIRNFFPSAVVDYVCNRQSANFIYGNRKISTVFPVFSGKKPPPQKEIDLIAKIITYGQYDLIISFPPLLDVQFFHAFDEKVIDFTLLAALIIRGEKQPLGINQISYQTYMFIHLMFSQLYRPVESNGFSGVSIALSDKAVEVADRFLEEKDVSLQQPLVFYNPDASSCFTRIPTNKQVLLIQSLLRFPEIGKLFLGAGHSKTGIENDILNSLSISERERVVVVPTAVPIDVYAGIIDHCQLFVSGDTGPLHIAAARKIRVSNQMPLRNKTAVVSIFGATPARIYGYDSLKPGFFPSNQDAPAHIYIAESPCRNITCINKSQKTCKTVHCFKQLNMQRISKDIKSILKVMIK